MNQLIDSTGRFAPSLPDSLRARFDVERSFVSKQFIEVPASRALSESQVNEFTRLFIRDAAEFQFGDVMPTVEDIEVPSDGIHLEATPGLCVLPNVPDQDDKSIDLKIQDASFSVKGS
jgi:hypothetical protein